jgi:hypothetical protein
MLDCKNIIDLINLGMKFDLIMKIVHIGGRFSPNNSEDMEILRRVGMRLTKLRVLLLYCQDAKIIEQMIANSKRLKVC